MTDASDEELAFLGPELERFVASGAWEKGQRATWVSRMFLVPKPGGKFRLIIDLRILNTYCRVMGLKYEGLKRLRNLGRRGDYMISADMLDGFYALGIREEYRDYFTVDIRGELYRLCGLPMGWCLSPYVFCTFMNAVVRHLRSPELSKQPPSYRTNPKRPSRHFLRNVMWRGVRLIPFVDDFLFLASSYEEGLKLAEHLDALFLKLGLQRSPTKCHWEPTQVLEHLGLIVDLHRCEFRAPEDKLKKIAKLAKELIQRGMRDQRRVPVRLLASLAGKAQFLYLAVPPARYYLRELHNITSTRVSWNGKVRMSRQLIRDLEWWSKVPSQHNRRPIHRSVETAYLHCDSSDFGWGAVLNDTKEARGFCYSEDRASHITFKELKAVRRAVESFLPHIIGRRVLLHEDNQAVCAVLTHLTTRSPTAMMTELRKLWYLLDIHDIQLRPRYIQSAANVWADRLSRELDNSDMQLNPRVFRKLDKLYGPHTIDRFATMENRLLERYNSCWLDPKTEAVDALRQPDKSWRQETNWVHPPWDLLDNLVLKLRRTGAAATVLTPLWPDRAWHQELLDMAEEYTVLPPSKDLFTHPRCGKSVRSGPPKWSVVAFKLGLRPGLT